MWSIQILFNDVWVTVQRGFKSRDEAETATGRWKQRNECEGDPFRAYEDPVLSEDEYAEHDQRAEDEAVYQNELRQQLANRV